MDDWPTLPQLARELEVADSTARRWAASFSDFLPRKGHGPTRRFHPQTREVLKRVKALYTAGFNTEQVADVLRREFPATIDTVAVSENDQRAHERKNIDTLQSALIALMEQQTVLQTRMAQMEERFVRELGETEQHLRAELAHAQAENAKLRDLIDERLEYRDHQITAEMRRMMTEQQAANAQKSFWHRLFGSKDK